MARKTAKDKPVAYFDSPDQVEEPGFYVVEETEKNGQAIHKPGSRVYPDDRADVSPDDRKTGWFDAPLSDEDGGDD